MKEVKDLAHLIELASQKKAVITDGPPCNGKPKPAAFLLQMPGWLIVKALKQGLYVYQPEDTE